MEDPGAAARRPCPGVRGAQARQARNERPSRPAPSRLDRRRNPAVAHGELVGRVVEQLVPARLRLQHHREGGVTAMLMRSMGSICTATLKDMG